MRVKFISFNFLLYEWGWHYDNIKFLQKIRSYIKFWQDVDSYCSPSNLKKMEVWIFYTITNLRQTPISIYDFGCPVQQAN